MINSPEYEVEHIIGYKFNNAAILKTALTHASITEAKGAVSGGVSNYQRLEFLGDSLLDFIVAEELFKLYQSYDEGMLTKIRSSIVSKAPLSGVVQGAGILNYIYKSNIETSALSEKVKSDIFESILCAIYLDSKSIETAREFVLRFLGANIRMAKKVEITDYKSALIEYCVSVNKSISFNCDDVTGPPHELKFFYSLFIVGEKVAEASGGTKRAAQQECARQACMLFGIIDK